MDKIKFIKALPETQKKYTAYIPKELWNKYRDDKINKPFKKVSFGNIHYEHYYDKVGKYSYLNHLDIERRKNYYKRHKIDYPIFSPDFFAKKILW